jgi:CheY-like chemotaxis protein/transcription initiation factor IIE alpha subunit
MIRGSLRDAPISEVFQIVASGQKSGVLLVEQDGTRAKVSFERGRVQFAQLEPGVHLGEILVRMELLTAHEVQQILVKQTSEDAGVPLGEVALKLGLIGEDELESALRAQSVEVLTELILWRQGTFHFSEAREALHGAQHSRGFDAMTLLMEVAQRLEAWRAGSVEPDAVFERCGDPTKVTLAQAGWEVLGYVDGRRSAESIAAELDLAEKQVYRILFELQERGVIRLAPYRLEAPVVLVVSPSAALQRLIRLALRRAQLKTVAASTLPDAVTLVQRHRPSALVLDDDSEQGYAFVRDLRKQPGQSHLPVVMLLSREVPGGLLSRLRRPKVHTLAKPFQELELQQAVTQLIGRSL